MRPRVLYYEGSLAGRGRIPELHELALVLQQELDRGSNPEAEIVGRELYLQVRGDVDPAIRRGVHNSGHNSLQTIVLRTTLATSMVKYLESIPWAAVTPHMLLDPGGTPLFGAEFCSVLLFLLFQSAWESNIARDGTSPLAALLIRQVRILDDLNLHPLLGQKCDMA